MGFLSYTYILTIGILGAVGAEWNTKDYMKREHSLIRPYQGMGMTIPYWDFMGNTIVTNNYVRLTPDLQSKQGAIWNSVRCVSVSTPSTSFKALRLPSSYTLILGTSMFDCVFQPCQLRNWELQVHFKVHGKGRELFGDGFAIWYAKERMQPGPVFGNKDFFHGLAVILDTYSNHNGPHNHQHPYISAMVNNGSLHYDHDRDGTHTQLAGCEAKFRNLDHDTHIAIRYEGDVLTVSTDIANKAAWKECLSVKGIKLPTGYYFGITATTGDLSDTHDILSVRLFQLELPNDAKTEDEDRSNILPSAEFFESPREHVDDPKPAAASGIKIFLIMLVVALAIIACVVIGIMFYQKHQEKSRKRFY